MKKITLLTALLFNAIVFSQAPTIQWQKCFGGTNTDQAKSVKQTPEGGYIIAGNTRSTDIDVIGNHGSQDILVIKISAQGIIEWKKAFGGTSDETANKIIPTSDGGYIFCGYTYSNNGNVSGNHGDMDVWVVKLAPNGDLSWQKTFGGSSQENAYDIQETANGYILACNTLSHNGDVTSYHGANDAWIVKIDFSGTIIWQKTYGGTKYENATSISKTADGGYIFAGTSGSSDGDINNHHGTENIDDFWVVKTDMSGNIEWSKSLGGTGADQAASIKQTSDGGYIVTGEITLGDGDITDFKGLRDYWIVKLNHSGSIEWQKTYGGSKDDSPYEIQQTTDGNYIVVGYTGSESEDNDVDFNHSTGLTGTSLDIWVLYLNSTGQILWQKSLGDNGYQECFGVQQTSDGGFILAGNTGGNSVAGDVTGFLGGNLDFWTVKLNASPLAINPYNNAEVSLFPNPAKDLLTINSGNRQFSGFIIYDTEGRIVKSDKGEVTRLDVSQLSSGIYFLNCTDNFGKISTTKFIKL